MDKPMNGVAGRTPLSINDAIEQGIEAAKSGNRRLARWQLESVTVGNDVRPEVWLWLAWVAESPSKAQAYLKNVATDPRFGQLAVGGMQWLSVLTGESVADIAPSAKFNSVAQTQSADGTSAINPAKIAAGMKTDESVVQCPSCEAILYVRSSAMGRPRLCPACDARFLVEMDRFGAVNACVLTSVSKESAQQETEVAAPMPRNIEIEKGNGDTVLVVDDSPTIRLHDSEQKWLSSPHREYRRRRFNGRSKRSARSHSARHQHAGHWWLRNLQTAANEQNHASHSGGDVVGQRWFV
jgi:hypothetical protein